jgi:hypothetical protein
MRRLAARGDDAGAYAILYGVLILAMCGMAAIVVDLGALRQNRRQTRLASDAAVIAGARNLNLQGAKSNPQQACTDAWGYLATNLGFKVASVNTGCTVFPTSYTDPCSYTSPVAYSPVTVGDYTITITWPVPDKSDLMKKPNVQPAAPVQEIDPNVDGKATEICTRIGVSVAQVSHPAFAGVFGVGDNTTITSSVGRSTLKPGGSGPIAALNVLEPKNCDAIVTSGQGYIHVKATTDSAGVLRAGIISIDSSGHETSGNRCPSGNPTVLDVAKDKSGAYVFADGLTNLDGKGQILMYALNPGVGNPGDAYTPNVPLLLQPVPTALAAPTGDKPVRDVYGTYATTLKTRFTASPLPLPYAASPAPYSTLPFVSLPCPALTCGPVLSKFACTIGQNLSVLLPAANYYLNCPGNPGLKVMGTLVFQGGNIVAAGGVDATGCLAINVPMLTATCPTLNAGKTEVATPSPTESILFLKTGDLTKGSQGSLFLERTFTYLNASGNTGNIGITGGSKVGEGILLWTDPHPTSGCIDACADARFGKLVLWTESVTSGNNNKQSLGGQSDLVLRGVMFMPKSEFDYKGGTSANQTNAQFWANNISVSGTSGLTMAPSPDDSVPSPLLGTALIR